ncbi:molybdopterin-guanine dinucleotide biosynthesis protein, partial [Propionibacterium freudenreichii]
SRPGAPLTAFLVGVAVGRGDSLEDQTAAISRLVARFGA